MQNGLYAVQFAAMGNQGGGVIVMRDGQGAGGDAGFAYIGTVNDNGDTLSGQIEVFQHDPGYPNVFAGLTNFTLAVQGKKHAEGSYSLTGTTNAVPGVPLNVTMRFLRPL